MQLCRMQNMIAKKKGKQKYRSELFSWHFSDEKSRETEKISSKNK